MSDKNRLIQLYGHGTDGSDGLPQGIHLRWFFDRRLGFPFGGFNIYRRELPREVEQMVHFRERYNDNYGPATSWSRTFDGIKEGEVLISSPHDFINDRDPHMPARFAYLQFRRQLTFKFPRMIHVAEIAGYIKQGSSLRVEGWHSATQTMVDAAVVEADPYEPLQIRVEGEMDLVRVIARSAGIFAIGYGWPVLVQTPGTDFQLLNRNYPIALPFTHPNYPLKHRHTGQPNGDWLEAEERRGAQAPYTRAQFQEMRLVFKDMFANDPPGSLQIRYQNYPAEDEGGRPLEEESELRILPADLLYLTSLDPTIARIIGVGGVDETAAPDVTYDYMIEGIWTKGNVWLLEEHVLTFEEQPLGLWPIPYKVIGDLLLDMTHYTFVDRSSDLAETVRALAFPDYSVFYLNIRFPAMVREAQLFISGDLSSAQADALAGGTVIQTVDGDSALEEQILHLSDAKGFDRIVLAGQGIFLHKICYDFDHLGHPESGKVVHRDVDPALRIGPASLPAPPANLRLASQSGQTVAPLGGSGGARDARLQVGVRWDSDAGENRDRYSLVRYQVQRQDVADWFFLNDGQAIVVNDVPDVLSAVLGRPGAPTPPYFEDILPQPMTPAYRVRGMDIFGRISPYSPPAEIAITAADYPPPPPPRNVQAVYLDAADPYLPAADAQLLAQKGVASALRVTWEWPQNLREQAPDVTAFHVHAQPGWLNSLVGTVTQAAIGLGGQATATIDLPGLQNAAPDALVGCTLQAAGLFFPVLGSGAQGAGGEVILTVGRPDLAAEPAQITAAASANPGAAALLSSRAAAVAYAPDTGPATLLLSPESPHYVDYGGATAWHYYRLETLPASAASVYEALIAPSPLQASAAEPKAYVQVTVTADNGSRASGTAPPATAMAVHRSAPPPPQRSPARDTVASFPDVYGRARFTFRFPGAEHAYEIYRAALAALIQVDEKARAGGRSRAPADYATYLAAYAADPALQAAVEAQIVSPQQVAYADLDNDLLQALASLPGNESAFARLHSGNLLAAAYSENGDFVYEDHSLPGRGAGAYFYRAKSIDTAQNSSPLGPASQPVWLRDVTPPRTPAMIDILGGEEKIVLRWWPNTETHLAEYRLYRTDDEAAAADTRLMDLLTTIQPGAHEEAIAPLADRPNRTRTGHAYHDETAVPGTIYYYRLVAVRQLVYDDGQAAEVSSLPTAVLQGQAYDVPPPPPVFDEAASGWVYVDDDGVVYAWDADLSQASNPQPAIRLVWSTAAPGQVVQIARRAAGSSLGSLVLNFELGDAIDPSRHFLLDREIPATASMVYSGKARSPSGLVSTSETTVDISRP